MATNKEFIKKVSARDVTSLEFTDIFSDRYDVYNVILEFTRSGTNQKQANILTLLDSSGTEITSGYGYTIMQLNLNTTGTYSERNDNSHGDITWISYDNEGSADIMIYNPFSSTAATFINGNSIGDTYGWLGSAWLNNTTSCSGLKWTFNGTGQYDEIIVKVYGIK